MSKYIMTAFLVTLIGVSLSACTNTVRGVGQDFEKAGQEIQKSTR